jgi:CBS domain-containing protein
LARDVMEPPTNTFSRQTSVVEAVFTFTKTRKRCLPVVENHQLVGLVSYMDILTKVLRA